MLDRTRTMTEHQQKLDKDRLRKETKAVDSARGGRLPQEQLRGQALYVVPEVASAEFGHCKARPGDRSLPGAG